MTNPQFISLLYKKTSKQQQKQTVAPMNFITRLERLLLLISLRAARAVLWGSLGPAESGNVDKFFS